MNTNKENTNPHTDNTAAVINDARDQINTLDEQIITLILERMTISARIQQARITSGGRRTNLSREMGILKRYRESLGKPGTALSMALLELCRGPLKATPKPTTPQKTTAQRSKQKQQ